MKFTSKSQNGAQAKNYFIERMELKPEEITQEAVADRLNMLFYEIRHATLVQDGRTKSQLKEANDKLFDCIDGFCDGAKGVQRLYHELKGGADFVFADNGQLIKIQKEPANPQGIYDATNYLIDVVNTIIDSRYIKVIKDRDAKQKE